MAKSRGSTFKKNKIKAFDRNLKTYGQYTCEYCLKAPLYKNKTGEKTMRDDLVTADHIVPLDQNGSNGLSNLKVCCFKCNHSKGNKLVRLFDDITIFVSAT